MPSSAGIWFPLGPLSVALFQSVLTHSWHNGGLVVRHPVAFGYYLGISCRCQFVKYSISARRIVSPLVTPSISERSSASVTRSSGSRVASRPRAADEFPVRVWIGENPHQVVGAVGLGA